MTYYYTYVQTAVFVYALIVVTRLCVKHFVHLEQYKVQIRRDQFANAAMQLKTSMNRVHCAMNARL